MNAIRSVVADFIIFFNPRTRAGRIRLGALVVLLIAAIMFLSWGDDAPTTGEETLREVRVARVDSFDNASTLSLIGTVESVNEAAIQAEAGGRVTSVRVALGDRVSAGQTIATLENAAQYASLLQAEGAYEAALAAAAASDISVSSAQTSRVTARNAALDAFRSAYTTTNNVILNNIDDFFSNPDSQSLPGLKLDGFGHTSELNDERIAFQDILPEWRDEANALTVNDDLQSALTESEARLNRVRAMVDTFILLLNEQEPPHSFTEDELAAYSVTFTSLRSSLDAELLATQNARTSLESAEEALRRAEIGGTGGIVSAADANVKQALGALRAAQANFSRTVIASPIGGSVNTLSIKSGDYISMGSPIALVANNNALLITTHVNESDRDRLNVGDPVAIEGGTDGSIVRIAPAIDPTTGKIEVHVGVDDDAELQNGDVVTLSVLSEPVRPSAGEDIRLPLAAFKILPEGPIAFSVGDDGRLVAHEVALGEIEGDRVIVTKGLTADMVIVTDARGLQEGMAVSVTKN